MTQETSFLRILVSLGIFLACPADWSRRSSSPWIISHLFVLTWVASERAWLWGIPGWVRKGLRDPETLAYLTNKVTGRGRESQTFQSHFISLRLILTQDAGLLCHTFLKKKSYPRILANATSTQEGTVGHICIFFHKRLWAIFALLFFWLG